MDNGSYSSREVEKAHSLEEQRINQEVAERRTKE